MAAPAQLLYLFSSNERPLYEQDILNVVAAPAGLSYRFRYRAEYLSDTAKHGWTSLSGLTALLHYSLQQPNRYHDPVFIPVRLATVRRAYVEADAYYVVELELGHAVALPEATRSGSEYSYAKAVNDWSKFLRDRSIPAPYDYWASLGPDVLAAGNAPAEVGTDLDSDLRLFVRTTKYLGGVVTLARARFFRVLGVFDRSGWAAKTREALPFDAESDSISLETGKAYVLGVLHSQPTTHEQVSTLEVVSDEDVVQVVGGGVVEIASSYDVVGVALHAPQISPDASREGVIRIAGAKDIIAPTLTVQVRNQQGAARTAAGLATAAGGLFLLGLPALLTGVPAEIRAGSLFLGIAVAVLGQFYLSGRIIPAK